jgi:hypothetical protein
MAGDNRTRPVRYMKGKQIGMTLYLPPQKYWQLKVMSRKLNVPVQRLLRDAVDEVLALELKAATWQPRGLPRQPAQ